MAVIRGASGAGLPPVHQRPLRGSQRSRFASLPRCPVHWIREYGLLQLVRSARWRRLHFIGCAAYLLFSILAEFVHVHPLVGLRLRRCEYGGQAVAGARPVALTAFPTSCAICQWQRAGARC